MTANKALRMYLSELFRRMCFQSHYLTAPDDAAFPYVVWELRGTGRDGSTDKYTLEINAYSDSNSLILEDMLDTLEELDGTRHWIGGFILAAYCNASPNCCRTGSESGNTVYVCQNYCAI